MEKKDFKALLIGRCMNFRFCMILLCIALKMPAYANVEFERVWLEHGIKKNGVEGMTVHAHFSIEGMKGDKVTAIAWIQDEDGNYLEKGNGNALNIQHNLSISYDNSLWEDVTFFIPYADMDFKSGQHSYYALVSIHTSGFETCLSVSDFVKFLGTGPENNRKARGERQMLANGGYVDRVENADGSITSTTVTKCTICQGSGKCNLCGGQGGLWGGYGQYRSYHICVSCGGGAQCKYCNGTGDNVLISTYYPSTNESYGYDLHTGNMISTAKGSGNYQSSSSNNEGVCSFCNGTGMDSFAWEAGSPKPRAGGYTHSSGGKCPYCGKYEWHQHVYCPKCHADKYL